MSGDNLRRFKSYIEKMISESIPLRASSNDTGEAVDGRGGNLSKFNTRPRDRDSVKLAVRQTCFYTLFVQFLTATNTVFL